MTLEQLKAIIAKATPGPWTLYERNNNGHVYTDHHSVVGLAVHDHPEYSSISNPIEISANGEFIATSRTALPAALALIEQMAEGYLDIQHTCDGQLKALSKCGITGGHRVVDIRIVRDQATEALAAYEAFKKNVAGG